MRHRTVVRSAAAALVVLLGVGSATAADAATDELGTGSIAGHLVDQDGNPVADAWVSVDGDTTFHFDFTFTDADGFYRLTDLPPDDYRVRFEPPGGPAQYAFGKWEFFEADLIPVVAGEETTVDEQLLPTGTITGQLLDSNGDPAAFAGVFAEPVDGGTFSFASTDEDGVYTMRVAPGEYVVGFEAGGVTQYAFGTFDFFEAEIFEVDAGETVVVNDQLLPTGTITGTLSDRDGSPVVDAFVSAETVDGGSHGFAWTDEDGGFTLQVPAGQYRVRFDVDALTQYAFGTVDPSQAEIFEVAAGEVVTVNDTLIPTGSIAGHLVDQDGNPVADAWVSVHGDTTSHFASTFTDEDGFYRLNRLPPDDYRVRFEPFGGPEQYAFGKRDFFEADLITVVADQEAVVDEQLLPTGTITGQLLDSNGEPAAFAGVFAEPVDGGTFSFASTDEDGMYTMRVAPGEYRVGFEAGGPVQYAFGTFDFLEAEIFSVGAGETVVVNDQLLPLGTITGTLSDRDGSPVADAHVSADPVDGGAHDSTTTDEDGAFTLHVPPGRYRVQFDVDQLIQYAFGTLDFSEAEIFDVAAGEVVTVDDTVIATGVVEGRFTDRDGTGIEGVEVNLEPLDGDLPSYFTVTDDTGFYRMPRVAPGSYRVHFISWEHNFEQYAFGAVNRADAAVIVVDADETVVVDDTRLPTGSVRVTARDALTGEPVMEFSLDLGLQFGDTTTGEVLFTDVPVGTHRITFAAADGYSYRDIATVTVVEGEVTEVTLTFHPRARVETTVVDASTGEPVEGVCLIPATTTSFVMPEAECPEVSGPDGRVTVEVDRGGTYQFLAWPRDAEGYGAQWVGRNGGTGFQLAAARVTVPEGGVATAPVVRMDPAGTVTGTVTLPDGTPARSGVVAIGNEPFNVGGGLGGVAIDEQGRYTIDWLGPYEWPLLFDVFGYAPQWSGGSPERHTADRVPVVSGATTTYDQRLEPGTEVTVSIDGDNVFLVALNARTGDRAGVWFLGGDPSDWTTPVLGPQRVKFLLFPGDGPARFIGGDDFDSATTYTIRPHKRQVIVLE